MIGLGSDKNVANIIILIRSKESETLIDRVSDSAPTDESESVGERAFCLLSKKDFQPYGCVFWAGLKDEFFTRLFNLIFLEKTLSKAQWTLCLTKFGQKFRPFLTRLHHVFVHLAQTVNTYRCIAFKFYGCVGEVWTV